MTHYFNQKYPDTQFLRNKARKNIPKFAFDYLEGGCNEELALARNSRDIQKVRLRSELLTTFEKSDLSVDLFGHTYSSPFGIAPIGLQGLMWPNAPEILAKAALKYNIPYVLSTVSSSSLERIAEVSEGHAWYQLYNPSDVDIRKDLLARIKAAQYPVLVVTVDVPTFGFRTRDIVNGLSMPPKMSVSNILQMMSRPKWLLNTALTGKPEMQSLKKYMPKDMPTDQLAEFMNKTVMGPVDETGLKQIRDSWQGPLVVKGIINPEDVKRAISIGADAVIISNHGARQLDAGETSINALGNIAKDDFNKIRIFMDSGIRSGTDIACSLASGAEFTFLGRPFVYSVGALGDKGGEHIINSLQIQLRQIMSQLRCEKISDLKNFLV